MERLATARELLQTIAHIPAISDILDCPEALRVLSQGRSPIRNRGNDAAHSLGGRGELRGLVKSKAAALLAYERTGLLALVDFLCQK